MFRKNTFLILVFLVFAFAFIWNVFLDNEKKNIRRNPAYTYGTLLRTKARKGAYKIIIYEYTINNKKYEESCLMDKKCNALFNQAIGLYFPVIYNRLKPQQSRMLISESSFKEFGLSLPDSLIWVKEYCR